MKEENIEKLINQPVDEDKPGLGQFYCVQCAKYFVDQTSLDSHLRGKNHKKRLKVLQEKPFTQEEAEFAAGHFYYVIKQQNTTTTTTTTTTKKIK